MISSAKLKSVDFYRKIPRDLTEASLSGAGLSIVAALAMVFLFGMELNNYLTVTTSTAVIVDRSTDGDFLRIDFNMSFPSLSCEFASVDVGDVLGTNRLNITKTIRKFSIDHDLKPTGSEFHSVPSSHFLKHGEEGDEESAEGSATLTASNFDSFSHQYPILVVNFFAPWCYWSKRLKPSWEKAAQTIRDRYDPEMDGRILLGKVDCTEEIDLCRRHHIQGYPSIRIFRKGSDLREDHGHHEHESYYGDRDTDSLVKTMEELVASIPREGSQKLALEDKSKNSAENAKRPAPKAGGCRIEGYVRVKKVPGNLIISARSGAHSFDTSQMNLSHVITHLSFGRILSPKVMSDVQRLIPYLGRSHDRLNGRSFINTRDFGANVTIEHYLQVVKTEVITTRFSTEHKLVEEYEYTAHSSLTQTVYIPVAKFHFELSPMQVLITENHKSFSHFITNVCAIIGGVFTVAGILDAILHNTIRMMKKVELGKNF
ncbi:protein disulfide-isomerase 5-3-like [Pistacia vera]|uniref:protein disulfide-isomerase 5-3-like n=1 Tax=Pistacia vera TaxID=55513 RepID=UPI001263E247|nr:protein disulfide-isomerase 5-3-like [Pistacia vera]